MTTEEKAKAYDKALALMKDCTPDKDGYVCVRPCDIFSELQESEDERIRKEIFHFVLENTLSTDMRQHRWLAWLEKQDEKPTIPKWKYKKDHTPLLRDSLILNKYGCVAKSTYGAIVSDVWVIDYNELAKLPKEESEKQSVEKEINPTLQEKERIDDAFTKMMLKPQVDGFDAELNALLKKYEHLPKKELQEPLEFYLGVVRDDLDIVREEKPKWSEEDERERKRVVGLLEGWLSTFKETCYAEECKFGIEWLKSIKKRMEE